METRTIFSDIGGIWRQVEPLSWIYGCVSLVDLFDCFAPIPNLEEEL